MFVLDFPVVQGSIDLLSLTNNVVSPLASCPCGVETLVNVFFDTCQGDVCRTLIPWDMLRVCRWERQPAMIRWKKARLAGHERRVLLFRN